MPSPTNQRVEATLCFDSTLGGSAAAWLAVTLAYVAIIVYGSLIPLNYEPASWEQTFAEFRELRDLELGVGNRADWLANLFLYVPLGFLAVVAASRVSRSVIWIVVASLLAFLVAAALAVVVEFVQLWFPPRTASQNDIRAELIGSGVGVLAGVVFVAWAGACRRRLEPWLRSLLPWWGAAYAAALLVYSVMPGDLVVSAEEFTKKVNAGRVNVIPINALPLSFDAVLRRTLQVLCFAPIGWMAIRSGRPVGSFQPRPRQLARELLRATTIGAALALGIEVLQLPIYSRETSLLAVLYGAVGSAVGGAARAVIFTTPDRRPAMVRSVINRVGPQRLWHVAAVIYAFAVPVVLLAPFTLVADAEERVGRWGSLFQPPFAALYYSTEFEVLTNVLQKGAVFGLLGALVAAGWPVFGDRRQRGSLCAVLLGAGLGLAIEIGQVYFAAHQPGSADVMIYTFFCWLGFWLASLAGPARAEEGAIARLSSA